MRTKQEVEKMLDAVEHHGLDNWIQQKQLVAVIRFLLDSLPAEQDDKENQG